MNKNNLKLILLLFIYIFKDIVIIYFKSKLGSKTSMPTINIVYKKDVIINLNIDSARLCNIIATCIDDLTTENIEEKEENKISIPLLFDSLLSNDEIILFFNNLQNWNIMDKDTFYNNIIHKLTFKIAQDK